MVCSPTGNAHSCTLVYECLTLRESIQLMLEASHLLWCKKGKVYNIAGEYAPMDLSQRTKGFQSIVRRFPIGAISMVAPFNFPLNLAAHKIAPAMAVGCVLC